MTQTALYSDKKLFFSLYKSALRRIRGIGVIYGIICLIAFPMFFTIEAFEAQQRALQGYSFPNFFGYPEIYTTSSVLLYFTAIIAGTILVSVYVNSFMHSKKAVDVFHALPVKRPQILLANFAAALTVLLGVQFICYGIVITVNEVTINQLTTLIVLEMLRVALLTVLMTAVVFLCCVCCNTSLDSAIFSAAFFAIVPCYTGLICLLMDEYVVGFSGADKIMYTALKFSPATMLYQTVSDGNITQGALLNIIYFAAAALLVALSCVLYIRRKSEMAQSANTKSPLYQFILLAASVGGGALFGFGYQGIFGYGIDRIIIVIVTSCIFTVAIYLVFNAVVSRNPKPSLRGLAGLAASLVVTAAFLLCVDGGFFGYESRIPATEKVQSVSINYAGDYANVASAVVSSHGGLNYLYGSNANITFTDTDEIEMVKDIHKTIVDSIDVTGIECIYDRVSIIYTLENGKEMVRIYRNDIPSEVVNQLIELEDLESFKRQRFPVLYESADMVKAFRIKDGFGRNEDTVTLSDSDTEKLYNAIAQDTLNITRQMKDQHTGPVLARIEVQYIDDYDTVMAHIGAKTAEAQTASYAQAAVAQTVVAEKADIAYYNTEQKRRQPLYHNVIFDVTEDCINTIKALREVGLGQYTTLTVPQDITAHVARVYYPFEESTATPYWSSANYFEQTTFYDNIRYEEELKSFSDPEKIAQLAESSSVRVYGPENEKALYVVLFTESDVNITNTYYEDATYMAYYIAGNDIPDFASYGEIQDYEIDYRGRYIKEF